MNEESLNRQIRAFLKKVGITSQREIEAAVRAAVEAGRVRPGDSLNARMTLEMDTLETPLVVEQPLKVE